MNIYRNDLAIEIKHEMNGWMSNIYFVVDINLIYCECSCSIQKLNDFSHVQFKISICIVGVVNVLSNIDNFFRKSSNLTTPKHSK